MRIYRAVIAAFVFAFMVGGFVWAQNAPVPSRPAGPAGIPPGPGFHRGYGPGGVPFGPGAHLSAMAAYLGLSKEQTDRIREIWSRSRGDTRDLRYELLQRRLEMHKLFTDPKATPQALMAKERELNGLRQNLHAKRFQALLDTRGVLTPQQIQKFDEMPMLRRGMGNWGCDMMGRGMGGIRGGMMGGGMMGGMGGMHHGMMGGMYDGYGSTDDDNTDDTME